MWEASQGLDGPLASLFLFCQHPPGQAVCRPCAHLCTPSTLGVLPWLPLGAVPQILRQTEVTVLRQNWAGKGASAELASAARCPPSSLPQGRQAVSGDTPHGLHRWLSGLLCLLTHSAVSCFRFPAGTRPSFWKALRPRTGLLFTLFPKLRSFVSVTSMLPYPLVPDAVFNLR